MPVTVQVHVPLLVERLAEAAELHQHAAKQAAAIRDLNSQLINRYRTYADSLEHSTESYVKELTKGIGLVGTDPALGTKDIQMLDAWRTKVVQSINYWNGALEPLRDLINGMTLAPIPNLVLPEPDAQPEPNGVVEPVANGVADDLPF